MDRDGCQRKTGDLWFDLERAKPSAHKDVNEVSVGAQWTRCHSDGKAGSVGVSRGLVGQVDAPNAAGDPGSMSKCFRSSDREVIAYYTLN